MSDNIMLMQRAPRTPDQEAFDEAKLGWSTCTTKEELEQKLAACRVIAARLHPSDMRMSFLTILFDALQQFTPYVSTVGKHYLCKGDIVTDYSRADRGLAFRGEVIRIWKDEGHTDSVDVKFPKPGSLSEYVSYNWAKLRDKWRNSKLGYVIGD